MDINLTTVNPWGLSNREYQVIELCAQGLKNEQIANKLGISVTTVSTHLNNVYQKFGISCDPRDVRVLSVLMFINKESIL